MTTCPCCGSDDVFEYERAYASDGTVTMTGNGLQCNYCTHYFYPGDIDCDHDENSIVETDLPYTFDEYGQRVYDYTCPYCHGTGQFWDCTPCEHCDGEGELWWLP